MFRRQTSLTYWIIFGLVLRLLLIPFSSHSDTRGHYLGSYFIVQKGAFFSLYDYISRLPAENPIFQMYGPKFLVYSPVTYWFHSLVLLVEKPFFPWSLYEKLIVDYGAAVSSPGYWFLQYLLKIPYLFVDLGCLYLLFKLVDKNKWTLATALWALNIPLFYSAYLMGQFDILIIFFWLLALYFIKQRWLSVAAVAVGLSAGFKPFGLFFLPLLPGSMFKNTLVGGVTYLAIISPYIFSSGYRQSALIAQQSDKMLFAKIWGLPVFILLLGLLYLYRLIKKTRFTWELLAIPLLFFYSVTHYHPQWFSWISPFLILFLAGYPRLRFPVICLVLLNILIIFSFDYTLNFGLFGIRYELFTHQEALISLIRTAIASTSAYLIYSLYHHAPAQK